MGRVDTVEPTPGWRVRCHPLCPSLFSVFQHDPEQSAELVDFINLCRPGMKLLDVGAHWGLFSLAAIHFGQPGASALAIEASPAAGKICQHNLILNGASESAKIVTAAAGNHCGELEMLTTGAGGADYFIVPSAARPDTIRVPQITVSRVCTEHRFEATHIKMDVEGFESEVLEGAGDFLWRRKPVLFMELHGSIIRSRGRDPSAVLAQLVDLGYHRFMQQNRVLSLEEIRSRSFNVRFFCVPNGRLLSQ